MDPQRWPQVKSLLAGALEQPDDARAVYLSAECEGQTTLCREVESLLDQTTDTLEAGADGFRLATNGAGDPNVGRRTGA